MQDESSELARLRAECAARERECAELKVTNRRAWRAATRFHTIAELVLDVPRMFRGGRDVWDVPQAFLAQVAARLSLGRVALYELGRGGLVPAAHIGPLPTIPWMGTPPEVALCEAGPGPDEPRFEAVVARSVGSVALWAWEADAGRGLLLADPREPFSGEDLVAVRTALRLFLDTHRRLASEAAQQQGLARARALNRLAYAFIHVETEHFEATLSAGVRDVVDQIGAVAGALFRLQPAAGVLRRLGEAHGIDAGLAPSEVPLGDAAELLDGLRLQETVMLRTGDSRERIVRRLLGQDPATRGHALCVPIAFRQGLEGFFAFLVPADSRPDGGEKDPFLRTLASVFASALAAQRDRTERQALQTQIQQAQKLDSLGVLAGGIAHDFNNILTPLFAGIELAILLSRDRPAVTSPLQGALSACERARKLVQQILLFSRKNAAERRPVDLRRLLGEAAELLRASMPPTIALEIITPPDPVGRPTTTVGDPNQLVQVLVNLGTNAWHALGDQPGRVVLAAQLTDVDDDASLKTLRPGTYAHITVSDTGPGIPAHIQPHIFDPFFTTKPAGKGTGMGLAVVHGIVTDHGGQVTFRTGSGGTAFHVFLPQSGTAADSTEVGISLAEFQGTEGVLVVDDEPEIGWRIQQLLARLGFRVEAFSRPSEALSRLQTDPDAFQLLITDFTMPEMTGLELARAAALLAPDLRILLCTGYHEPLTAEVLAKARVLGTIQKPFRYTTLARQVRQTLDGPA